MHLGQRLLAAVPARRTTALLVALVAGGGVLTGLVAAGALTGLDQFSLDHLMPWLDPGHRGSSGWAGLYRPFAGDAPVGAKILDAWTYPCSVLISALVAAGAAAVLWRRLDPVAALAPAAAWVAGNGLEVIGKYSITRPPLYGTAAGSRIHIAAYDSSFPSGHTIRCVVVAYALVLVWRRAAAPIVVWALLVPAALVVQAAHTITDVVGGMIVGAILLVLMRALVVSAPTAPLGTRRRSSA